MSCDHLRGSVETLDAALADLEHRRRVGLLSGKVDKLGSREEAVVQIQTLGLKNSIEISIIRAYNFRAVRILRKPSRSHHHPHIVNQTPAPSTCSS